MRIGPTLVLLALCASPILRAEDAGTPPVTTPPAGGSTPAGGAAPAAGTEQPVAPTPASGGGNAGGPGGKRSQVPKDQRALVGALRALNQALKDLKNAPDDFDGKKAADITDCEKARDDLQAALDYRKAHPLDDTPKQ